MVKTRSCSNALSAKPPIQGSVFSESVALGKSEFPYNLFIEIDLEYLELELSISEIIDTFFKFL